MKDYEVGFWVVLAVGVTLFVAFGGAKDEPPQVVSTMRFQVMKTTNWQVRDPKTDDKFWVLPNNVPRLQEAIATLESIKQQAEAP